MLPLPMDIRDSTCNFPLFRRTMKRIYSSAEKSVEELFMRVLAVCILFISQSLVAFALPAPPADSSDKTATASCDFEDGMEITVHYSEAVLGSKDEPHNGKVWVPAGSPITLFTQVPLTLNHVDIPVGAYSMYVIPNKKEWTLIVNKNVSNPKTYDQTQDLARAPMELGGVTSPPKQLQVSFAHVAPKQCSIRIYYETIGAFVEFNEK
jgi:Protein of unknown function (DUF2911)